MVKALDSQLRFDSSGGDGESVSHLDVLQHLVVGQPLYYNKEQLVATQGRFRRH